MTLICGNSAGHDYHYKPWFTHTHNSPVWSKYFLKDLPQLREFDKR